MLADDLDGRHMQVPGSPVVAEPSPIFENLVLARRGESVYAGETR